MASVRLHLPAHYLRLISILGLLVCVAGVEVYVRWWRGHYDSTYGTVVVALMLLFNHLAYGGFNWPRRITAAIRMLTWSWIVFGSSYIVYVWVVALRE